MSTSNVILGIDIGGTFTDFVLVRGGKITPYKCLSTYPDPSQGLLTGIEHLAPPPSANIVHGSTVATNALLERRGARTALIATQGFADVLEIGRQDRPSLYTLTPVKSYSLVPPELRFEVMERVTSEGVPLLSPDADALARLADQIQEFGVESVAICLLFSFLYPAHEQLIGAILQEHVAVSLSSDILPEYREYERTGTTVINAYIMPVVARYLAQIEESIKGRLRIMQSNGGVITAATARKEAVRTVLSGPAGGAVGAFHVARLAGFDHIISFDMGGTSTDVALFPGEIIYTREARVAELPLRLSVIDIHTVGAGGGSIARVDAGGALSVGPQSAGADPGPACYGRGDAPTVTDANLLLGRLHPDHFLGGQMRLYPERARNVLSGLAAEMRTGTPEEAAWSIVRVADATMERAIRQTSVERGYDPREFTLVSFGGAGPLHACSLAETLRIPRILVPRFPGVLSALGMTIADLIKDYSQTVLIDQDVLNVQTLDTIFAPLEARARRDLLDEGIQLPDIHLARALDMRYAGQSFEIEVAQPDDREWIKAFHSAHQKRYGYKREGSPVQTVNMRLRAIGSGPKPVLKPLTAGSANPADAQLGDAQVWFTADEPVSTALYSRDRLLAGNILPGPAVVFQLDATTVIFPGWNAVVDTWGNLLLTR